MSAAIFLDIDGVLATRATYHAYRVKHGGNPACVTSKLLCPRRVGLLETIRSATGARIVLSTSWAMQAPVESIAAWLSGLGLCGLGDIDVTPRKMSSYRINEIRWWLEAHPEVDRFLILEDEWDMHELEAHTIRTTWERGLLSEHVARGIEILGVRRGMVAA